MLAIHHIDGNEWNLAAVCQSHNHEVQSNGRMTRGFFLSRKRLNPRRSIVAIRRFGLFSPSARASELTGNYGLDSQQSKLETSL